MPESSYAQNVSSELSALCAHGNTAVKLYGYDSCFRADAADPWRTVTEYQPPRRLLKSGQDQLNIHMRAFMQQPSK
jgi:hypothetical protein